MKLGLALAGGGIRGIAHAGVLKAFEDNNIKIDIIGGASSGSLVAVLYAMGFSGNEILNLFKKYGDDIIGVSSIPIISNFDDKNLKKFNITGIRSGEEIEKIYNKVAYELGIKKISDIKMPLVIPATNFIDCQEYIFSSMLPSTIKDNKYITDSNIGVAVRASSSFSGVFQPCYYKDKIFLDGGILDNVPVKSIKKFGVDKIIAVNFNSDSITENSNFMDIIMKTLDIMGNKISEESLKIADLIITVPTDGTGLLDLEKIDYCYNSGYEKAIECIDKVKELVL